MNKKFKAPYWCRKNCAYRNDEDCIYPLLLKVGYNVKIGKRKCWTYKKKRKINESIP